MLYLEDLESFSCSNPDCSDHEGNLELKTKCHAEGTRAVFNREDGCLDLVCFVCGAKTASIAVASEEMEAFFDEDDDDDGPADDPQYPLPRFPAYMLN